jgi:hypothetical protein
MTFDVTDIRPTIVPKSDQLNSEQLLSGPRVIVVSDVTGGSSKEQPLTVHYDGEEGRPYKPGLTMRKLLAHAWGHDATQWIGKSMELYCDPNVRFGGEVVGGIRISRMSDINTKGIRVSLTASKGKKALHEVELLQDSPELVRALAAIEAATNGETLKKAKALATSLKSASDIERAKAVYQAKVEALRAAAPVSGTPDADREAA